MIRTGDTSYRYRRTSEREQEIHLTDTEEQVIRTGGTSYRYRKTSEGEQEIHLTDTEKQVRENRRYISQIQKNK